MSTKRVAQWGEDGKTAVEVPTNRSQQRLKTIAKPGRGWDEDVHTVARPVDAILPAEAFREGQVALPVLPPASVVTPPPLPLARLASVAPAPLAPAVETASPSDESLVDDRASVSSTAPRARARLRPGQWVLVCLTAAVFGALGYAAVMSWIGLL